MRPLRIRAYLQDGRVAGFDPWLPLDSILSYAWMRQHHPDVFYDNIREQGREVIIDDMPFERRGKEKDWYWACSFNTAPPLAEYTRYWHKRFDLQYERYLAGVKGKIRTNSGRYRSYRMPLTVFLFNFLEWYAVGDADEILALCRLVTHVGKKTAQGFGAVEKWEVEPWPHDWSEEREEKLTRPLQAARCPEPRGVLMECGIRPPYWDVNNWRICWWRRWQ